MKAPKIKCYSSGGNVDLTKLSPEDLARYNSLPDDVSKSDFLKTLGVADTSSGVAAAPGTSGLVKGAIAAAPAAGEFAAKGLGIIAGKNVGDKGYVAQTTGQGILKDAGKGAGIGATIGSVVPGIGNVAGAGIGAAVGGIYGGIKGFKNGETDQRDFANAKVKASVDAKQSKIDELNQTGMIHYADGGKIPIKKETLDQKERRLAKEGLKDNQYKTTIIPLPADTTEKKKPAGIASLAEGGAIDGVGTAKSDSINAKVKPGSFVVPAENADEAEELREDYLDDETDEANLNQGGGVPVKLSNGEHLFTPEEKKYLQGMGVNFNKLAPNAKNKEGMADGGNVNDPVKAPVKKETLDQKEKRFLKEGLRDNQYKKTIIPLEEPKEKDKEGIVKLADGGKVSPVKEPVKKESAEVKERKLAKEGLKDNQYKITVTPLVEDKKKEQSLAEGGGVEGGDDLNSLLKSLEESDKKKQALKKSLDEQEKNKNLKSDEKSRVAEAKRRTNQEIESLKKEKDAILKEANPGDRGLNEVSTERIRKRISDYKKKESELENYSNPNNYKNTALGASYNPKTAQKNASDKSYDGPVKDIASLGEVAPGKKSEESPIKVPATASGVKSTSNSSGANKSGTVNKGVADEQNYQRSLGDTTKMSSVLDKKQPGDGIATLAGTDRKSTNAPSSITPKKAEAATSGKKGFGVTPENALAFGQMGLGIYSLFKDGKRPVDSIDPDFDASVRGAQASAAYGFNPAERQIQEGNINSLRAGDIDVIRNQTGGNAGQALSNLRASSVTSADNMVRLAAADSNLRLQKQQYADQMVSQRAGMKRQLFQDKLNAFNVNQQSGADLLGSGISNYFGNKWRQDQLKAQQEANDVSKINYDGIFDVVSAMQKNPSTKSSVTLTDTQ